MASINAVNNNAPAGAHAQAVASDANVTAADQPAPKAPPGSVGHQSGAIQSQLVSGNPGGVGAGFGLGVAFDVNS
jgi:hypothetical protein